jgi:phage shock protein PspC (stress-responsive transcriptional regulator)
VNIAPGIGAVLQLDAAMVTVYVVLAVRLGNWDS